MLWIVCAGRLYNSYPECILNVTHVRTCIIRTVRDMVTWQRNMLKNQFFIARNVRQMILRGVGDPLTDFYLPPQKLPQIRIKKLRVEVGRRRECEFIFVTYVDCYICYILLQMFYCASNRWCYLLYTDTHMVLFTTFYIIL